MMNACSSWTHSTFPWDLSMLEARLAEARSIGQHTAADITDTACVVSRLCVDGNSLAQHLEYLGMFHLVHPLCDTPAFALCFGRTPSVVLGVKKGTSDLVEDNAKGPSLPSSS